MDSKKRIKHVLKKKIDGFFGLGSVTALTPISSAIESDTNVLKLIQKDNITYYEIITENNKSFHAIHRDNDLPSIINSGGTK